jgi:hypothetical protein
MANNKPYQPSLFTEQAMEEALKNIREYIDKSIEKDKVRTIRMKPFQIKDNVKKIHRY